MTGTATARLDELRARTGCQEGHLTGKVIVDQVYAHYQHEHLEFRHPRGGMARYLEAPLIEGAYGIFGRVAREYLDDGGHEAMKREMESLAEDGGVATHAPVEFDDLRRSGHPQVWVGERLIFDRPPRQHRLTEEELRIKARLRKLPPELIGWIWWHVMHMQEPPPHLRGARPPWRR
jgi:hypothetical protein